LVALVTFIIAIRDLWGGGRGATASGNSRIGLLFLSTASVQSARVEVFRQRLRELGYVEGKNILIEHRYADGKLDRLPDLAAELMRLKVDVIVTTGLAVSAAKKASATIPIVFAAAGDPVGSGLVSSWRDQAGISRDLASCCQI